MRSFGFTLIDLLTTLAIALILLMVGIPAFSTLIQNMRVKTSTLSLLEAIELTRSQAVFYNQRATIAKLKDWENGWEIFTDNNNDGTRNGDEKILQHHEKLNGIRITTNSPVKNNVSYIGTGESRNAAGTGAGGFQAGTFTVCPRQKGKGYQLILARGGRVRMTEIKAEECEPD